MWYAVFDYEYTKEVLLQKPALYRLGLTNERFKPSVFWGWVAYAFWQGGLILFLVFFCN